MDKHIVLLKVDILKWTNILSIFRQHQYNTYCSVFQIRPFGLCCFDIHATKQAYNRLFPTKNKSVAIFFHEESAYGHEEASKRLFSDFTRDKYVSGRQKNGKWPEIGPKLANIHKNPSLRRSWTCRFRKSAWGRPGPIKIGRKWDLSFWKMGNFKWVFLFSAVLF